MSSLERETTRQFVGWAVLVVLGVPAAPVVIAATIMIPWALHDDPGPRSVLFTLVVITTDVILFVAGRRLRQSGLQNAPLSMLLFVGALLAPAYVGVRAIDAGLRIPQYIV